MKAVTVSLAVAAASCVAAQTYVATVLAPPPAYAYLYGSGAGGSRHGAIAAFPNESAQRAVLFNEKAFFDVTPAGVAGAYINDSDNDQHVGASTGSQGTTAYAYLWLGTSAINMHPPGYNGISELLGIGGGQQAGYVFFGFYCSECGRTVQKHAGVWRGSASSFQKLHSRQHDFTQAEGTDGVQQVGQGEKISTGAYHALLWNGPGSFAVDLHPAGGYVLSNARAVFKGQQVGSVEGAATR
jgi:hypothetical protein